MENFELNLSIDIAKSGRSDKLQKPASRPAARYVGVSRNFGLASVEKPSGAAKAPAENPADPAETKNPVRLQKPGPAASTGSVTPIAKAAPAGAAGLAGSDGPDGSAGENIALKFDMTSQDLLTGFIMSEVLGRPKCFSMRRRPAGR